ncbi:MAG: quinol:cytochrome C oxidoreductase [Crocinitomicaceae bacterium]|nr:quinol:cytochrome C oxidoreductase [Crocinitomicaceae bacterium]MCF8411429.1 quinol:cytochrome C oxidoreductase [Crocinitomicaceae bacterium]MCF8444017.1 quinol:cytochrome C oxidoreductase [Crocinitomicaceae bacterium]
MEFTIPTRAKKITLSLILIGVALAVIGVATGFDDHQFTTRLLTNGLINAFFFFAIALGALFFLALQYATETGWYASVKRVIEGIAGVLPYGMGFLALILLIITFLDGAHIYVWMDPETTNPASHHFDAIIEGKKPYLNKVFFWIRTIVYLVTYYVFWNGFRKRSLEEDRIGGTSLHFKNYYKGATFLVFFAVFSSTSAWDWIMSIDVHWFSTLFGWYTFAGMWCSAMVVIVLTTIYLKKLGYLERVNDSHIHDIGKWTFATSFLWSYLFFSQFMLIWYANIGEEVTYYQLRMESFKVLYFSMFLINFAFPMLILMSRDAKRNYGVLTLVGIIILMGHWTDVYLMISAGSLGPKATIGLLEIGIALVCVGLFIRILLNNLTKAPLMPVNHPFLDESVHHEI